MTEPPTRPPRRDAARNRARLLEAARRLFAAHGADVALEDIARVAEVSRTTLYRHFESREGLAAVLAEEGLAAVEAHAAQRRDDPRGALELFDHVLALQLESRFVSSLLPRDDASLTAVTRRVGRVFEPLLRVGAAAGTVRPGVDVLDVLLALQSSEIFALATDPEDRVRRHERGRLLLLHGLFADESVRAHEERRAR